MKFRSKKLPPEVAYSVEKIDLFCGGLEKTLNLFGVFTVL